MSKQKEKIYHINNKEVFEYILKNDIEWKNLKKRIYITGKIFFDLWFNTPPKKRSENLDAWGERYTENKLEEMMRINPSKYEIVEVTECNMVEILDSAK